MEIERKTFNQVEMIVLQGRMDSREAKKLEDLLEELFAQVKYHLAIDMTDLDYISGRGLRCLIWGVKECRRFNRGDLRLCRVPERIMSVLDIAGLTPLFKFYGTQLDAVGSF